MTTAYPSVSEAYLEKLRFLVHHQRLLVVVAFHTLDKPANRGRVEGRHPLDWMLFPAVLGMVYPINAIGLVKKEKYKNLYCATSRAGFYQEKTVRAECVLGLARTQPQNSHAPAHRTANWLFDYHFRGTGQHFSQIAEMPPLRHKQSKERTHWSKQLCRNKALLWPCAPLSGGGPDSQNSQFAVQKSRWKQGQTEKEKSLRIWSYNCSRGRFNKRVHLLSLLISSLELWKWCHYWLPRFRWISSLSFKTMKLTS